MRPDAAESLTSHLPLWLDRMSVLQIECLRSDPGSRRNPRAEGTYNHPSVSLPPVGHLPGCRRRAPTALDHSYRYLPHFSSSSPRGDTTQRTAPVRSVIPGDHSPALSREEPGATSPEPLNHACAQPRQEGGESTVPTIPCATGNPVSCTGSKVSACLRDSCRPQLLDNNVGVSRHPVVMRGNVGSTAVLGQFPDSVYSFPKCRQS